MLKFLFCFVFGFYSSIYATSRAKYRESPEDEFRFKNALNYSELLPLVAWKTLECIDSSKYQYSPKKLLKTIMSRLYSSQKVLFRVHPYTFDILRLERSIMDGRPFLGPSTQKKNVLNLLWRVLHITDKNAVFYLQEFIDRHTDLKIFRADTLEEEDKEYLCDVLWDLLFIQKDTFWNCWGCLPWSG